METEKASQSAGYPPPYSADPQTTPAPQIDPAPVQTAPAPMQTANASVTPTIIVAGTRPMGSQPQSAVCPNCNTNVVTEIRYRSNTKTHIIAALMCASCLWPCAAAVYCVDKLKGIDHYCPRCQGFLGSYKQ